LPELQLPEVKGKSILVKTNMVEYRQGRPLTTNPAIIEACVKLLDHLGAAKVTVADGPAEYRDTEFILQATGVGEMCKKLAVPFVDLNLDDLVRLENTDGFTTLKEWFLPKTVAQADAVVSLPKMKTHHWAGMTASMKNLFGTVPGRKYGWPKNILHTMGIDFSIIDINHLVKPAFAFVDAIVAMEGEGPLNGVAKDAGFVVLGKDLAAVDATCARTMMLNPDMMTYLKLAGEVVGNIKTDDIRVIGASVKEVQQQFELPDTWKGGRLMGTSSQGGT
jgi:uncharacterized protein (DUF362 family)